MPNPRDIASILSQGMGTSMHWYPQDVPLSKLAGCFVAMANTHGGTLLLGIAPRSNQVQGVSDIQETIDRVFQAAMLAEPPLVLPVPNIQEVDGYKVIRIVVPSGLPHVYSIQGRYLGRQGYQNSPLNARRLRELLMERGVIQFETRIPPNASLDDLDGRQINAYMEALGLPGSESPEEFLLRRGCLQSVDGVKLPTYAALLLFGRHPQQWLPSATILAARFPGVTFSDQFIKQDIRGTLPEQLRQAETFVRDHLRSVVRLVGLTRQEIPEYPFEAVRELLVNAVAHRDYNQGGDCIHLHIYADRLEVHSPGGLPGPVNIDNLLDARFSRNAVIAQVLSDLGFVERMGYGLNRVVAVMRQNGLRLPKFVEADGSFRVILQSNEIAPVSGESVDDLDKYEAVGMNPRQQAALRYLVAKKRITNREYQALCPEVSAETLRRDLVDMVSKGVLLKIGDRKATYYILKKG